MVMAWKNLQGFSRDAAGPPVPYTGGIFGLQETSAADQVFAASQPTGRVLMG